jgi:hypothetical protein
VSTQINRISKKQQDANELADEVKNDISQAAKFIFQQANNMEQRQREQMRQSSDSPSKLQLSQTEQQVDFKSIINRNSFSIKNSRQLQKQTALSVQQNSCEFNKHNPVNPDRGSLIQAQEKAKISN